MMPLKRLLAPNELTGAEILKAVQERYDGDRLPPILWQVLEADAKAPIVEEDSVSDGGSEGFVEPPF